MDNTNISGGVPTEEQLEKIRERYLELENDIEGKL